MSFHVSEVFFQCSVKCSVRIVPYVGGFDVSVGGGELHILLLHHLDSLFVIRLFIDEGTQVSGHLCEFSRGRL